LKILKKEKMEIDILEKKESLQNGIMGNIETEF